MSRKSIFLLALISLSLLVHFAWFGHPNDTVFDEVHFGKFISAYFTHEYYFDIHPPLGKLILAGWGKVWGFEPGFSFANIGDAFPDKTYLALRFLPTLAGALLPLVIYGLARQLGMSRTASLLAGALIALDNALLVQSRLILLDSFLLLFGFSALWCYLRWRSGGTKWLLLAAGTLGGMAMGIKWTGMTFLALIVILEMFHLRQDSPRWSSGEAGWRGTARQRLLPVVVSLVVVPFLVYYLAFAMHFGLLMKTGTGDAFMSAAFQHDLRGNAYAGETDLKPLNPVEKFTELNAQMYESNQRLTATHPYSSEWYTWPFMARPIFYWVADTSRIYLLGNPIVWWGSTVALLLMLGHMLGSRWKNIQHSQFIMTGGWLMNILPFIGISRVMFLYHYFTALIWAVLMLAWLVDRSRRPARAAVAIGTLALVAFVFFAPLSYGLPLSDHAYNLRVLFTSWR